MQNHVSNWKAAGVQKLYMGPTLRLVCEHTYMHDSNYIYDDVNNSNLGILY